MLSHSLDNCGILLQERNCPFQNDLLKIIKLKITIDFSSRKKEKILFFTQKFQSRELWSAILMSFHGFPRKYKNSLGKKELRELSSHAN